MKGLSVLNLYAPRVQGLILVLVGSMTFLAFLYAAILSKLLPPSEYYFVAAIQNDRCLFIPSTINIILIVLQLKLTASWKSIQKRNGPF
ncbi:hypothetical protein DCAR_0728354 [Daucus carota subsp. sativus]|uniref:Uncharacterized protein n=1 Tax=Daucus carota subsp. sativus TaxID=79200 RepID=A0A161X546_DAUCS|nr:hypothetical protein DCAR_0728354 [Daucus carota subsp. sativus]